MKESIKSLIDKGYFSNIDLYFAEAVSNNDPKYFLLLALTSRAYHLGHTMIPLSTYLYQPEEWFKEHAISYKETAHQPLLNIAGIRTKEDWLPLLTTLKDQHSTSKMPLVITEDAVYLNKNDHYEASIVEFFKTRNNTVEISTITTISDHLNRLFPNPHGNAIDRQKLAAANALLQKISVITGGPGTGKTTTVTKLLLLLLLISDDPTHITLAAPTGKAAARLSESIIQQKEKLIAHFPMYAQAINKIPKESTTLHRLLKIHPQTGTSPFNEENPILTDVLIIDEASMIDLKLFYTLAQAIAHSTKVVILGDKDQLSSVEAGAIMAEICQYEGYDDAHLNALSVLMNQPLEDTFKGKIPNNFVTFLKESHRFHEHSGIGQLANVVNHQKSDALSEIWETHKEELQFHPLPNSQWFKDIESALSSYVTKTQESNPEPKQLFGTLNKVRILCAMNVGEYGSVAINQMICERLFGQKEETQFFHGQVIMIQQNSHEHQLYNGDIGIILKNGERLKAYFESEKGEIRSLAIQLLPHFTTAFAMSIHKSQGSEFDHVLLFLSDYSTAILSKELVYTGVTRAKKWLEIYASESVLKKAIHSPTKRFSGISQRLYH